MDAKSADQYNEKGHTMNAVTIDVDMLESLPAKTMLKLVEKQQTARRNLEKFQRTIREFSALFRWFEEHDLEPCFDMSYGSVDVGFTGDGERLKAVWGELRRAGYKTESRPKKGDTSFHSFWDAPNAEFARIFLNFSSSVCKRVQIGTETKEVPIYETRCDELPGIELLESPLAPALPAPAEEIPF